MAKKDKKRVAIPEETKRQVMLEAGFRCSVPRCPNDLSLEVHHIDYDRDNHDPANLLVLCSNCHGRATRKEIDRKACLMIKDLLRLQKSSKAELEEVKDEIIDVVRSAVGSQDCARPLIQHNRGTQRPNGRIQVATSQVMTFHRSGVPLPNEVLRCLMASLYWSGELHAALEIQLIVMRSGVPSATDHFNLGVLLAETGQEGAEEAYRKALDEDPMDTHAWTNLGIFMKANHRTEEAERAYRTALGIDQRDAVAWSNLASLLGETGRDEEAEAAVRMAISIDSDFPQAWFNLGSVLRARDDYSEAELAYRRAVELEPNYAAAWSQLGLVLNYLGRQDEAVEAARKASSTAQHNANEHNGLAYLLWECGRFEDAELEVMEALKDDPNHVYANATLGLLRLEQNDLGEGRQGYEKAIELAPDDLSLQQKYHYEYGRALARNGRPDDARTELEAALSIDATYVPREQIEAELAKLG